MDSVKISRDAFLMHNESSLKKIKEPGAGEIAQRLRVPTFLTEDLGSVPSTLCLEAHNLPVKPAPGDLKPSPGLSAHQHEWAHTHTETHVYT